MLVYFVGGVSYMEIAALRFLSAQRECKQRLSLDPIQTKLSIPLP